MTPPSASIPISPNRAIQFTATSGRQRTQPQDGGGEAADVRPRDRLPRPRMSVHIVPRRRDGGDSAGSASAAPTSAVEPSGHDIPEIVEERSESPQHARLTGSNVESPSLAPGDTLAPPLPTSHHAHLSPLQALQEEDARETRSFSSTDTTATGATGKFGPHRPPVVSASKGSAYKPDEVGPDNRPIAHPNALILEVGLPLTSGQSERLQGLQKLVEEDHQKVKGILAGKLPYLALAPAKDGGAKVGHPTLAEAIKLHMMERGEPVPEGDDPQARVGIEIVNRGKPTSVLIAGSSRYPEIEELGDKPYQRLAKQLTKSGWPMVYEPTDPAEEKAKAGKKKAPETEGEAAGGAA